MTYRECFTESGRSGRRTVLKSQSLNQAEPDRVTFVPISKHGKKQIEDAFRRTLLE